MTPRPTTVDLRSIEQPLYGQLAAVGVVVFGLGLMVGGWRWGVAAGVGVAAAMLYYVILAAQVRRQFARGRVPKMVILVGCLAARQIVCLAAPAACFFSLGTAWLASLATLVLARHWIMLVAWRGNRAALAAS